MLDTKDIKKLTDYQLKAFKEVFFTKQDGKKLQADVQKLQTDVFVLKEDSAETKSSLHNLETKIDKVQNSVDGLTKLYKDNSQEIFVLNHRMKNAEDFLDKAAPKLGLEFKH